MSRRGRFSLAGAGAIALIALVALPSLSGIGIDGASDVPVYRVQRGEFVRRIRAEGNLQAVNATILGPPAEIRQPLKIAWLAPDGSHVSEGDVVIRFDPSDMEKNLREGRYDRDTTDSRIAQRTAREDGNQRNLARDAEIAGKELEYAEQFQSKDTLIFSRTEIVESEIDRGLAHRRRDHAEQAGAIQGELSQAELDLLGIERRKAELKISQAEQGLQALEVRAPHDGIFVLKEVWGRVPEVGQVVWGGNPVAEIPKLDEMEARVYVLEADAGGLENGLEAELVLDARLDMPYAASVRKVDSLAQRRNRRVPVQYFGVTLQLEHTDPATMKPGQRVQATLSLDERDDVIAVPRQAVFEVEGEKVVYVRRGGSFAPVEVTLGPAALGRVVIEEGLDEGLLVALRDPTRSLDESSTDDGETQAGPVTR